jgi:hypothetical protein
VCSKSSKAMMFSETVLKFSLIGQTQFSKMNCSPVSVFHAAMICSGDPFRAYNGSPRGLTGSQWLKNDPGGSGQRSGSDKRIRSRATSLGTIT